MSENKLIVASADWAETIPDWVKKEVESERLMKGMEQVLPSYKQKAGEEKVGDAEAFTYLYTASCGGPMTSETAELYLYLGALMMARRVGKESLPEDMKERLEKGLDSHGKYQLDLLKEKLYRARGGKINHWLFDVLKQVADGSERYSKMEIE